MATLWLTHGVPIKVVSERLGHANISVTLQIYGHLLPNMQAEATQRMDYLLVAENEGVDSLPDGLIRFVNSRERPSLFDRYYQDYRSGLKRVTEIPNGGL